MMIIAKQVKTIQIQETCLIFLLYFGSNSGNDSEILAILSEGLLPLLLLCLSITMIIWVLSLQEEQGLFCYSAKIVQYFTRLDGREFRNALVSRD